MWLMHVETRQLKEFFNNDIPAYAILSHTWGKEEVTFQDLKTKDHQQKLGYAKIEGCCRQAQKDGLSYVWVDTCCIDKTSSTELSEAINSMFHWYEAAKVCYAYLADVPPDKLRWETIWAFRTSRWFERGWTLQELLAPVRILFFDAGWNPINPAKIKMSDVYKSYSEYTPSANVASRQAEQYAILSEVTSIPKSVLDKTIALASVSIACRLSWAAKRKTTRIEDMAYCLMGILQVNMPLLYGEGEKAFLRLQEIAISSSDDISALAWGFGTSWKDMETLGGGSVLARSPVAFLHHPPSHIQHFRHKPRIHTTVTGHGLHIDLAVVCIDHKNRTWLAIIEEDTLQRYELAFGTAIVLKLVESGDVPVFERALGCPPVRIQGMGLRRLIFQRGRSPVRTVYLQNSDTLTTMGAIHVESTSFSIRYLRNQFNLLAIPKSTSSRWPLPIPTLPGRRIIEPTVSNPYYVSPRHDHMREYAPQSKHPHDGIVPRLEFVISLAQLYERGFALCSLYPPLMNGQQVERRLLQMQDGEKTILPVLVCQGPANQTFISVFTNNAGANFAMEVHIVWDVVSVKDSEVTFEKWGRKKWVRNDTAIAWHTNTSTNPILHREPPELKWENYVNLSVKVSKDQYYRWFHILATRRTDSSQIRKPGACDCTVQVVDGCLHEDGSISGPTIHD